MSKLTWLVAATVWLLADASGAFTIGGPSSDGWVAVPYTTSPDFADDQLTGANEADLVGDMSNPALFTAFDDAGTPSLTDGTIAFRLRFGADENPLGFKHVGLVGIDVDQNQSVDILIVVDNKGGSPEIAIRRVTGAGTSPSTTGINRSSGIVYSQNASNYSWLSVSAVDPGLPADLDGDGNDYYLSFSVPFADLVAQVNALAIPGFGGLTQITEVLFVAGSSTNSNSVNQDWSGPNGGTNWSQPWASVGGFSQPMTIPEPGTAALLALGTALLAHVGRRRS